MIGSGPIVIGQLEIRLFGRWACRVPRSAGLTVSLVSSESGGHRMTGPEYADVTASSQSPAFVVTVIAQQESSAATGLTHCWPLLAARRRSTPRVALHENRTLERYGVELIGADFPKPSNAVRIVTVQDIVARSAANPPVNRVFQHADEVRETILSPSSASP